MKWLATILFVSITPLMALAENTGSHNRSPYAGEETRAIKSLSAEDIAELGRGGGWGLAKVAELNGMPGPAHLLDLKVEIGLTGAQVALVEGLFEEMQAKAIAEGERFIESERALDEAFGNRTITKESLRHALAGIEQSRTALRFIHLTAHLAAVDILSDAQITRYDSLRGYVEDSCADVPPGHDPVMWRRHNDCG